MKKNMKWFFTSLVFLLGCHTSQNTNTVRVGVVDGPESDVMESVVPIAKEKYNLDVKLIKFTDYVSPNAALADGDLDVNAFQTKPYLDETVKAKGYKLAVVGKTFLYPIGLYSKKYKKLDEIPNGSKIAIANDPSNEGRALLILEKAKLIELKKDAGILATVADIVSNPKKLNIVTLDAAQLPRSLDDVAVSAINTNYAIPAGLNPTKDAIFVEPKDSPYMNLFVSREDNQKELKILNLIKAYQTKATIARADKIFQGAEIAGFDANN